MIVIGDMLGVAPEDRDALLRWSDDMVKALGSPDPTAMDRAAVAAMEYAEYITGGGRAAPARQPDQRPHRHPGPRRDRGRPARRVVPHLRVAAHPDRRGRDDPPRHQRRHVRAAHPSRPVRPAGRRPDRAAAGRRGDAALGLARSRTWPAPRPGTSSSTARRSPGARSCCCSTRRPTGTRRCSTSPRRFDVTRTPNDHMAFGFGSHFCLGNRLARMELPVMFDRLFERLPDLALATRRRAAEAERQLRLRLRARCRSPSRRRPPSGPRPDGPAAGRSTRRPLADALAAPGRPGLGAGRRSAGEGRSTCAELPGRPRLRDGGRSRSPRRPTTIPTSTSGGGRCAWRSSPTTPAGSPSSTWPWPGRSTPWGTGPRRAPSPRRGDRGGQ